MPRHMVSPQQVYDDPAKWLNVVHEVHEMLMGIMDAVFPDFREKLAGIHCLECEGEAPFVVYDPAEGMKAKLCTGYVDDPQVLLFLTDIPQDN